jgi:hypothetical protein
MRDIFAMFCFRRESRKPLAPAWHPARKCELAEAEPNVCAAAIYAKGEMQRVGHSRQVQAVALDKTGTLTMGVPSVTDVLTGPMFSSREAALRAAAAVTQETAHPYSRALFRACDGYVSARRPCC